MREPLFLKAQIVIPVGDIYETIAWYQRVLGFEPRYIHGSGKRGETEHFANYAILGRDIAEVQKKGITNRVQESWSATNRLAYPPSHARHIVAFARNSFEGCTGAQAQLGHSHMATTLDIYTHASGSAQRDAVNLLEEQLFPNVPKLESCGSIAETESQLVQ